MLLDKLRSVTDTEAAGVIDLLKTENRPHQGIENTIPLGFGYPGNESLPGEVRCDEELGGLLNHYYVGRKAA